MKYNKCIVVFIVLMVLVLPVAIVEAVRPKRPPSPVVVVKVVEMQLEEPVTLIGTVETEQHSLVATEISGLVLELLYKEGDFVEKGDVLARLKKELLEIELREARAALKEGMARLEFAESQTIRYQGLYEKEVVPIEELQESISERNAWAERVFQYKAKIERFDYDIDNMEIKSPFSGNIIAKHTEIGEWLEKGDAVYELINLDSAYVLVNVPEHIAVTLQRNDEARIRFDAFGDLTVNGHVIAVIPQSSKTARTLPVKIGFQNKDRKIKNGLFSRVTLVTGTKTASNFVPKDAVVEIDGKKFIFTIKDNAAAPIPVKTGISHDNLMEVIGPLKAGMEVIVRGNERVMPGQAVKVVE